VISVVTTANLTADSFSHDRTYGRSWFGDLAELLIYNRALPEAERLAVEEYLATKYSIFTADLPAPQVSPPGGAFDLAQAVNLGSAVPGVAIHYTTDGTEATESSPLYEEPFVIDASTKVRARAFRAGTNPSQETIATFLRRDTPTPADVPNLVLWVRGDGGLPLDESGRWADQSDRSNDLVQADIGKRPRVFVDAEIGMPLIRLDGKGDTLSFTDRLTNIRTVFWVTRADVAATTTRFLLGDKTEYSFYGGTTQIWHASNSSASVRNGVTRLNGQQIVGTTTNRPTEVSVLSLVTTGNVSADAFSHDRTNGSSWFGDLGELIIYDRALKDSEVQAIEAFLAARYGIALAP
jgi:hypothetical protein